VSARDANSRGLQSVQLGGCQGSLVLERVVGAVVGRRLAPAGKRDKGRVGVPAARSVCRP